MSKELETTVQEMLKEETWTRATITNYTKNNLTELTTLIEKARQENCVAEIKALCDAHLTHAKDSIIALYISGILSVRDGALDNSNLVTLVDIFEKAHKEPIIEYLCETILEEDENNKFALRTLAKTYREENSDKVWPLYEKIVKLDFDEADLAKALADHYEATDKELSIEYNKKALLRYISAKNIAPIQALWTKLVKAIPEEIDFFLLVQRKIAKSISEDKSALLMHEVYDYYKDEQKWDTAIEIIKLILSIDPKDNWARNEIVQCYTGKYKTHTNLDKYIRNSNLTDNYRNVFEAINDFEKHIAFDVKSYVSHRTWGIGIIREVKDDNLSVYFGKKNGTHEISLKMAVSSLTPLAFDHIWVKKARSQKAELVDFVKNNPAETLKIIIKSFGNSCDFKRIKAELVPSILSTGEWTNWNSKAKKILETDSTFGVNPNDINQYIVREHAISIEEKYANEFKAQKQFFSRIDILMKFIQDETDKESDFFADMYNYFIGFIKTITKVTDQILASYLLVQHIGVLLPQHAYACKYTFAQLYDDINDENSSTDPREMYEALKDTKNTNLKDLFLANIKHLPDWADEYIKLFPTVLKESMLKALEDNGHTDKLKALVKNSFEDVKDYREAAIYFFENCQDKDWVKESGVSYEKQLIALLNIISLTFLEITNHINTTENKKINKAATQLLFKNDTLSNYMFSNDEETVTKMYTLVDDIKDLEPNLKAGLRSKILSKYPDYKFHTTEEKVAAPRGMLVTIKKLEEKKALEEDISKVQLPAVALEVSEAREKGDLKENAEYHAAKEKQHYLNKQLQKLQEELNRAVVFDPTTATSSVISFATTVTLLNMNTNAEETFTLLGPWESDTEKNIISYLSPFGNQLLDHKVGDELSFEINENRYSYKVSKIELAKF